MPLGCSSCVSSWYFLCFHLGFRNKGCSPVLPLSLSSYPRVLSDLPQEIPAPCQLSTRGVGEKMQFFQSHWEGQVCSCDWNQLPAQLRTLSILRSFWSHEHWPQWQLWEGAHTVLALSWKAGLGLVRPVCLCDREQWAKKRIWEECAWQVGWRHLIHLISQTLLLL